MDFGTGADCGPGLGLRCDALSARGDLTEGAVRLAGPVRFERLALDESVIAVEADYLLEPLLASAVARTPIPGDLVLGSRTTTQIALAWRLIERDSGRTLFERRADEPVLQELPRRAYVEDCD